ncbi:ribosome maturation factor RimM [Piscinibacter sakaiensis]|uniref:ribosome maturation factor RimM n=1 Tax=Piscinibacter sakaiensis TaxID=1547922 RepID=UPI003AADAEC2
MKPADGGADAPQMPTDAIEVGRIGEAWGIKGWFRVQAFAADPQALFSSKRWYLKAPPAGAVKRPGGAAAMAALPPLLKIIEAKTHADGIVAHAQEIDDRAGAEALRGAVICIARSSFPTADDDEYYWVDLIGLDVVNRQGERLGQVLGLIDTGPHAVLRVGPADQPVVAADEVLIPFVAAYVDGVSLDERRISVDWGADY